MRPIRTGREEGQTDGRVDKGSDNSVIFALEGRKYHNMRWGVAKHGGLG
jgi:hypothetical protein